MKTKILLCFAIAAASIFSSCKKEETTVPVQLMLTDAPGDWEEVNVEIAAMEVKTSKDTTKWYSITTKPGIYNLLEFQNGLETMIADGEVPQSVLKEVRFTLGTHNTIKVTGEIYPLQAPLKDDAGLVVKIDKQLNQTLNSFTLDFDAALSVKEESGGVYKLKPVINLKSK